MPTEIHRIVRTSETSYRIRPNPDGSALDGSEGVVLEWSDDGKTWDGYFSISSEALNGVANAIAEFASAGD